MAFRFWLIFSAKLLRTKGEIFPDNEKSIFAMNDLNLDLSLRSSVRMGIGRRWSPNRIAVRTRRR